MGQLHHERKTQNALYLAASEYLAAGISVIPLREKIPAVPWTEYQTRLPTRAELSAWWGPRSKEAFNVGVVTGKLSGLVVVDADSKGDATFWEGQFPTTPAIVKTGGERDGRHYYYAYASRAAHIGNRVGIDGRKLDLRADAAVVLAPPSITQSSYRWVGCSVTHFLGSLPEFSPDWIPESKATTLPHPSRNNLDDLEASERVLRARRYIAKIGPAVEGQGGDRVTFKAACRLRDFGLSFEEALAELIRWNETAEPPWEHVELARKLRIAFETKN